MSQDLLEQLLRAVHALYQGQSEAERHAANQWLMGFAGTPDAWAAAHALLQQPEEEVQYFGANLLYMKVKAEWHGMAEEAKASVYDGIWQLIRAFPQQASRPEAPSRWLRLSVGMRRVCLALALAAVRSTEVVPAFISSALALAEEGPAASIALELLVALPQEVLAEEAAIDASAPSRGELRARLPQVLALMQTVCQSIPEAYAATMRCLHAWLSLQAGGSLQMLFSTYPQLLAAALHALAAPEPELNQAAADALLELLSATNTQLAPSCKSALEPATRVAEKLMHMAGELQLEQTLAHSACADERTVCVCRVLAALAERAVDLIATEEGPLLNMVQLMLCMLGGELRVAELTVDFWCGIQDTPLEQRHEQLRHPLYRKLHQLIMRQCTLPPDFTTWDECDEPQQDDFDRFREQSALEVLGTCLQLLHTEFIGTLRTAMGSAEWQQLEAAMFVVRGLHVELKGILSRADDLGELPLSVMQEQKRAVQELLSGLFSQLCDWRPNGQPMLLVIAVVRLCGAFGKWLQAERPQLLLGCLRLTLQAIEMPPAAEYAAEAFRALCVHGKRHLGDPSTVNQVLAACQPFLRSRDLDGTWRVALTEGVARLIGEMRSPANAGQLLQLLVAEPCTALSSLMDRLPVPSDGVSAEAVKAAERELAPELALNITLISSAIRFCDAFSKEVHPVPAVLQGCWPLLQAAGARCGETSVLQALCDLYSKAMTTLGPVLEPLLPSMLQQIRDSFCATPVVGCLTCLTQALELYGDKDDEVHAALADAVERVIDVVCNWLRTTADPEVEPDLLTAFFEMCHRGLVFRPGLMLGLECMPTLFESAICCIAHQEFQHTRAALTFLCLFMSGTDSANQFRETAADCLQRNGEQLVGQCVLGLVSASPLNLIDHQVELLRVAADACPGAVRGWLVATFQTPGFSCGALSPHSSAVGAFVQLVSQQPALSTSEFQSVASDFSRMCRAKLGPNCLERYLRK